MKKPSPFFYIPRGANGKTGFGICTDPKERNQHYASHSGMIVPFVKLYRETQPFHSEELEDQTKRHFIKEGKIWEIDYQGRKKSRKWKSEWLKDDVSFEEVLNFVEKTIDRQHLKLELVAENWNFTLDDV